MDTLEKIKQLSSSLEWSCKKCPDFLFSFLYVCNMDRKKAECKQFTPFWDNAGIAIKFNELLEENQ